MHEKLSDQYLQSIKGHSPWSQARRIIKQILLHNQDRFESQKMNFMKMLELQDYIKEKLADLETAKDGSLEQFIKNVEKLME